MTDAPLDWQALADFGACPRYFHLRHIHRLIPPATPAPLAKSFLGGVALDHHFRAQAGDATALHPLTAIQRNDPALAPARAVLPQVLSSVEAYLQHYRREPLRTLRAATRLVLGPVAAKAHRIVQQSGRILLSVVRFVGEPNAAAHAPERHLSDGHLLTLHLAALRHALPPDLPVLPYGGILVDLVGTSSDVSFRRFPLTFSRQLALEHRDTLRALVAAVRQARDTDSYPKAARRGACENHHGYGRPCPFWTLCWSNGSEADFTRREQPQENS